MSKRESALAMLEAASIEEMRGERAAIGSLCTRGARSILKAMIAGRQPEVLDPSDPRAANLPGKTFSVDVSGVAPEFIPEDEWRKKRREILDGFVKEAIERM